MPIQSRKLVVAASLGACLSGCASMGPDYAVSKASDKEAAFLESQTQNNVYGQWVSDSDLRVILGFPLDHAAKLPLSSLKADVSGDLITLHLSIETDKSVDTSGPVTLCADMMKLTYVLHGLPKQPYRVQVEPMQYGNLGKWDVLPLEIK
jgi:hypothetical protein